MHPIKPKGLSLGLGSLFLEYLGFGFGKSLANSELDNLKYKKKFLIFGYGFEYKFKKLEKNQN